MKLYITASFKGTENQQEVEHLCSLVRQSGFQDFCFARDIENFQNIFNTTHELMQRAKQEIAKCDALLIDYNGPAHGRMIALGIAYGLGIKVIVITKRGTKVKAGVEGVSDVVIEYDQIEDIVEPLAETLTEWQN